MMKLIRPALVGDYKSFVNDFGNVITSGQYKDSSASQRFDTEMWSAISHKTYEKYIHRCDETYLTPLIPEKREYVINMSLSATQKQFLYVNNNSNYYSL